MSQSFGNNINSFNTAVTNNFAVGDERSDILAWLSPLDPRLRHQDIQDRRVENVGEWVLQTREFRSWYAGSEGGESDNAVLFCYGDPGVGKTYISSLVIDSLCDQAGGQNTTVACLYFDFAIQKEQSCTSMLGALLKQLVCGLEEIPEEITRAYQNQKKAIGGRGPRLADIVRMLQTTARGGRVFICIDALDECAEGHRVKILDSLNQFLQKTPDTRIFVTGRPHIRPEIGRRLSGRVTSVHISPKRDDIIKYLHNRLDEDTNPDAMDSSLAADILKKSPEDISEIFLLVSLNIDAILQETTIHRRRQKLSAMTGGLGLGDAYGATIDRIKRQGGEKSRLGMAALMWVAHSERPLKAGELLHALAVEVGSPNLNTDNVPSIGTLLACCQGLIIIDKETSTVRLIHFTLQEYLRAHPDLFGTTHSTMAETCLSYLNSQQIKVISTCPSPDLQSTPFLEYSSLYWGVHARKDLSDCAKLLALKLFDDCSNHISTKILLRAQNPYFYGVDFDKSYFFSGLHFASVFGIVEIVADLVGMDGCDIDLEDHRGNTALVWAARNGHEGVVNMLLEKSGADPEKPNDNGQTPLLWAAWNGHEGVVETLLGRDEVNPDKPDSYGQTPLWCAASSGHEGVVKMLLGRDDVNPKISDNNGQTPLWRAAFSGHEGAVTMLLRRDDVNPNKPDINGQTPLWRAACSGYEGVMRILLGRDDVNPNKPNIYGQTPLWRAACSGYEGAMKMLLGRDDVNPNEPDIINGQTPLWRAACSGYGGVVKMLLERSDVNPNEPDINSQTPLWRAACSGYGGVVKSLLERGDVHPNKPDINSQTPLWRAACSGYEGVVKILLGRSDVNPNEPDINGQTPLWRAACSGYEGVVKILLERGDVHPNKPDINGQTPLWRAACSGYRGVIKMLLERSDVNPNEPDTNGQTPLSCAACYGHEEVVRILLTRDDVSPDKPDISNQTPLWWAAKNGHAGVVKTLLGRNDVSPDKPNNDGQTPLQVASRNRHAGVIALLQPPSSANPSAF